MSDLHYFVFWWLSILALGFVFMPLSMLVFRNFRDKGWIFSKAIGVGITGWMVWFLSSCHIVKFNTAGIWICLVICLMANAGLLFYEVKYKKISINISNFINNLFE
ncbi:MAG: hypothetical protein J6Y89_03025 [Lachnospiraceae bacterium]|nr:hypothetical protein [Lachnospiraceae bacterium]